MNWLKTPLVLWSLVIRYALSKFFGWSISPVVSNWVYFLRLANNNITIKKLNNDEVIILNNQFKHRAIVRIHTSDILVYIQLFFHGEYARLDDFTLNLHPVILDLGANVGFFSLLARFRWNDSKIIAVEPDAKNFAQLQRQFQQNSMNDAHAVQLAIWKDNEPVFLNNSPDTLEWSYNVTSSHRLGLEPVSGISLQDLLQRYHLTTVDLIKIDIEGTEVTLFNDPVFIQTICRAVKFLVMETHDAAEQIAIGNKLNEMGFEVLHERELILARNKKWFL